MKPILIIFLLLLPATHAFTQIKRGQFLVGGSISFESTKEERPINTTTKINSFFISPNVGYFVFNAITIGVRTDISSYNYKNENSDSHSTAASVSPFFRCYVLPVATKKVNAFVDLGYVHTKNTFRNSSNTTYSSKAKGYKISVGPSIFLTDHIALEFTLGFKHTDTYDKYISSTIVNSFDTGFGFQIHLGKSKNKV